jgi:hypothetical protein
MRSLTLEQVRKAGLVAISMDEDGYFAKFEGGRFYHSSVDKQAGWQPCWVEADAPGEEFTAWHHLPGCDCEFCV